MQEDQLAPNQHNMQMQLEVPDEQDHQQLNGGLALLNLPDVDPIWAERSRNADATRLWANYFAQGNYKFLHVSIPSQWANFFIVLLLLPDIYYWAKELITSKVLPLMRNNEGVVDFYISKKCPKQISCKSIHDSRLEGDCKGKGVFWEANVDLAATPKKSSKKRSTSIVVDTNLRRSDRIKQVSGGFKRNICTDRKCLAYSSNPPTLSNQVIRALGTELCQIEEEELADEVLLKKRKQSSPVGEKKNPSQKKRSHEGEGASKENQEKDDDANAQA